MNTMGCVSIIPRIRLPTLFPIAQSKPLSHLESKISLDADASNVSKIKGPDRLQNSLPCAEKTVISVVTLSRITDHRTSRTIQASIAGARMSVILITPTIGQTFLSTVPACGSPHDLDQQARPNQFTEPNRPDTRHASLHITYQTLAIRTDMPGSAGADELEATAIAMEMWLLCHTEHLVRRWQDLRAVTKNA